MSPSLLLLLIHTGVCLLATYLAYDLIRRRLS